MINKDLKVAVLGAGAMGCLFGGLLAEKELNVILIDVWKEHVEAINKNGLKMDGHGGDRFIKVKATSDPSSVEPVDVIIVMCKATALEPALNSIKNIIGEKTTFMSFQNGIGHEEIMQKIVERNKARKNKDYKVADEIRKELLDKGVLIEDKDDKTLWKFK